MVLTYTRAPQAVIEYFTALGVTPLLFWLLLAIICLLLGAFIEIMLHFYLTVPIFAAIALSFDRDLLRLFVVFTGFARIGMLTPPVCVSIYTAVGVIWLASSKVSPDRAFRDIPAFVLVRIVYGALIVAMSAAALWLPRALL